MDQLSSPAGSYVAGQTTAQSSVGVLENPIFALTLEGEEFPETPTDVGVAPNHRLSQFITALLLVGPFAGVLAAVALLFGRGVTWLDIGLGIAFYAIAGHGVTAGFHRMSAHRGFAPTRGTKIALYLAGSLAFEGTPTGWVANHRRHHAYTDVTGDPHSPHLDTHTTWARTRGAVHAHVGWLFGPDETDIHRWAPDLEADPDIAMISKLFPLLCLVSLGAPALIGWAVTGTGAGALGGFVWGGLVRVFILQHSTFAVNSACHIWGKKPFSTRQQDRSTNFAPLALLSMGESWHNLHHSNPTYACHGVDRGQLDSTALVIRLLERTGRISNVRWPTPAAITARRRPGYPLGRGVRSLLVRIAERKNLGDGCDGAAVGVPDDAPSEPALSTR